MVHAAVLIVNTGAIRADRQTMKRFVVPVVLVVVFAGVLGALPAGRTIVNPEGAPLFYAFVRQQEASVMGGESEAFLDRDAIVAGIQDIAEELHVLPPGGMWRVPSNSGVILGYFGDGNAPEALQLVALEVPIGTKPVEIVPFRRTSAAASDATYRIERWEVPEFSEPIILDGMNGEWESRQPIIRFGAMEAAVRIEDGVHGRALTQDDALYWRNNGTGIRSVKSVLTDRMLYVAIESTEAIESATFYHFRLFPDRDTASSAGQLVVPVDKRSGPVVFHAPAGNVTLVGQYVRRGAFVELSVARDAIESTMPLVFAHDDWSVDIASSHGDETTREHFTWGTIFFNDISGR